MMKIAVAFLLGLASVSAADMMPGGMEEMNMEKKAEAEAEEGRRLQDTLTCAPNIVKRGDVTVGTMVWDGITCRRSISLSRLWRWWYVYLEAGVEYTVEVHRKDCGFDPAVAVWYDKPQPFPCRHFMLSQLDNSNIAAADDNGGVPDFCRCPFCPPDSPFSDPYVTFRAPVTGYYWISVANYLSNGCGSGGNFDYTLKVYEGPYDPFIVLPGVGWDPHMKSFAGEYFDYMGECDLKLMHVPEFAGASQDLDIDIRTTIRYDYSFIEAVAVKIGDDILEVDSWGEYALNGVEDVDVSGAATVLRKGKKISSVGGYPLFHTEEEFNGWTKHTFDIAVSADSNITITNTKDMVNVEFNHASYDLFGKVSGMLGNYKGQMMARDGVTNLHDDMDAMADEWQIKRDEPSLFRTVRYPQSPNKCILPDIEAKEKRRLGEGIKVEEAEEACARFKANPDAFHNCVYDVTATNDLELAAVGAF